MKKTGFFILSISLAVVVCGWVFLKNGEPVKVKTIIAKKGELIATLSATGTVVSAQEANIKAEVKGRVQDVNLHPGDHVAAAAVMVVIDDREIAERFQGAKADLRESKEKVRQAKRNYEGLAMVYAAGGASRQSVEDAESSLVMAEAAASRASSEMRKCQDALDKLQIRAPFDGIVTRKEINKGEWVSQGEGLFAIADASSRKIEVMVDETDAGLVGIGQTVELSSEAFPGHEWLERVTEIDPAVQKKEGANTIRIRTTCGSQSPNLKLGQQVDAKIRTANRLDIVKLPFECLTGSAGQTTVAIIKDGMVRFVPVKTGIEDATSVEIVKGVSAGETVIVPEGKLLKEGQRVESAGQEMSQS